jgi:hypothetical protein
MDFCMYCIVQPIVFFIAITVILISIPIVLISMLILACVVFVLDKIGDLNGRNNSKGHSDRE